ncbi:hypothetical protein [Brevundimonas sp. R86498]|uniref:hypothetical protein n=1 Tax=Brevundimonas sp. R86498 TaxID=3093845 RepID=UPI0037C804C1
MIMRLSPLLALTAVATLSLGTMACTETEQDRTAVEADAAGDNVEQATSEAGQELREGAAAAGEVLESGAMKAAQAVESGAGNLADRLEAEQAEAAAQGRPGAVDPVTDERQ